MLAKEIDACNLNCPLPLLRTFAAFSELEEGEHVRVIADDPATVKDMMAMEKAVPNAVIISQQAIGEFQLFEIRKQEADNE